MGSLFWIAERAGFRRYDLFLAIRNIIKSFRRKSESRFFRREFACPNFLRSYGDRLSGRALTADEVYNFFNEDREVRLYKAQLGSGNAIMLDVRWHMLVVRM